MNCPRCGTVLGDASRFCSGCGLRLGDRPALADIGVKKGFILAAAIGLVIHIGCRSFFVFSYLILDFTRDSGRGVSPLPYQLAGLALIPFFIFLAALAMDQIKRENKSLAIGALIALPLLLLAHMAQFITGWVEAISGSREEHFLNLLKCLAEPPGLAIFSAMFVLLLIKKKRLGIIFIANLVVILSSLGSFFQFIGGYLFPLNEGEYSLGGYLLGGLGAIAGMAFLLVALYINQVRFERWQSMHEPVGR